MKMSTLSSTNFTEGNMMLKEHTQMINNKIKLHILGVAMNKLGNWLIVEVTAADSVSWWKLLANMWQKTTEVKC